MADEPLHVRLWKITRKHERETGLRLVEDHFELHVHPFTWDDYVLSLPPLQQEQLRGDPPMLNGFKVIRDHRVDQGEAELICTWRSKI